MKFMFNNEEELAQTSEILLQNCYSALKEAGIVSCKILQMNYLDPPPGPAGERYRRSAFSSKSMTVGKFIFNLYLIY